MQKIIPFLWFDNQVEKAANFYVSVFKNSKVKQITYYIGEEFSDIPAKFLTEWMKDPVGLERVMHEVIQMTKLDLARLQKAFAGK
jgi:hypothetical protein